MKVFYLILFLFFFPFSTYAIEYSCIDKKHGHLSKMSIEDELVKYEDQKGEPLDYKIVENSEIALMAISKVTTEENPILNYIFIIKDKSLAFNANLRSINNNYNEIFTKNIRSLIFRDHSCLNQNCSRATHRIF